MAHIVEFVPEKPELLLQTASSLPAVLQCLLVNREEILVEVAYRINSVSVFWPSGVTGV